jgi:hypothetical protein
MLRTDFLVHWTGKNIHTDPQTLSAQQRTAYVDRLLGLLQNGFWMTEPPERVLGRGASWFDYRAPMVCFTEIRLSRAMAHAAAYGLCGIAVSRAFVLQRFGTPVFYVRNHGDETVIGNMNYVLDYLQSRANTGDHDAKVAIDSLGDSIARLKGMSNANSDDFTFLEEQEWRIIHRADLEVRGYASSNASAMPKFFLNLPAIEVQGLVFPDAATRDQTLADPRFVTWLSTRHPLAFTLTLGECALF